MIDKTSENNNVPALSTNDKPIRSIGMLIVLATFCVFGLWAAFAPIDSSALASGVLVVKAYKKTVQHLDGGIVAKILTKDGDLVQEGQTLLILDDAQIKAQLEISLGQNITLAAQVARLSAERDQLKKIEFPALLNDPENARTVEAKIAETHIFNSHKSSHEGQIGVLNQRVSQISSKINGLQSQIASKKQLVGSYSEEIKDLKELLAEGFADKQRLRELERNHAIQTGDIAQFEAEIATNQMLISETRLQILQIQKQFQEEVVSKLSEAQAQLNDAQQRVAASRDKLDRIVIKAPASGMVLGLATHTENGVITPGRPILDIVPQGAELIIEAQVSPMDIDRVVVGLQAEIRFSAFKQSQTPKMEGKVISLSPDRITDERTGNAYYLAKVEVTPKSLKNLGDLQLLPGMPAEVLINTGERTLFRYLAQPASNFFARSFIED
ncbi:MAG: HlyD family type I secretion periplasmic adaptor subunit [Methylococcaceae bacterium]|jgi:epimerase transport system membrane fusion protein